MIKESYFSRGSRTPRQSVVGQEASFKVKRLLLLRLLLVSAHSTNGRYGRRVVGNPDTYQSVRGWSVQ